MKIHVRYLTINDSGISDRGTTAVIVALFYACQNYVLTFLLRHRFSERCCEMKTRDCVFIMANCIWDVVQNLNHA